MAEQPQQPVELGGSSNPSPGLNSHAQVRHNTAEDAHTRLGALGPAEGGGLRDCQQPPRAGLLTHNAWCLQEPRISESTNSSTSPVKQCPANQALPSLAAKRKAASQFVKECTGIAPPYATDQLFRAALKDGVLLCKVVNSVWPNAVQEVSALWLACVAARLLLLGALMLMRLLRKHPAL